MKTRNKHLLYLAIAKAVAKMGTCPRAQVGALIVKNDKPISFGFNGAARGEPHCTDVGCILETRRGRKHCIRALHAESNAIDNAREDVRGATLYCTHVPCWDCLRRLRNAGIKLLVYYAGSYQDDHRQQDLLGKFERVEVKGVKLSSFWGEGCSC